MTRMDIENCNNIDKLKEICLAQRSQLSYIGEILVSESKWEMSPEVAIKKIRGYLTKHQHDVELK